MAFVTGHRPIMWVKAMPPLLLAAFFCLAQAQKPVSSGMQEFRFSLVQIPVWVTTKKDRPKRNLKKRDFKLFVDGYPTAFESWIPSYNRPVEMIYLLDISGSMMVGDKLQGAIGVISYLLKHHPPGDRWKILVFSDAAVFPVLDHTHAGDWPRLKARIRAYGKTALFDALSQSRSYFNAASLASRAILLFTDGLDNQSRLTESQFLIVLETLDVPVFAVGIADGFIPNDPAAQADMGIQTMKNITGISGGEYFIAESAKDLPRISRVLLKKLRPHYLLALTVERGKYESRHGISVKVKRVPPARVRYRKGYVGLLPEIIGGTR